MLKIVENGPQSYYIVDASVPGGEDLEHQTSRPSAEAALARWQAKRGEGIRLLVSVDVEQAVENLSRLDPRRDMLAALLKGKAGEVRRRVGRVESAGDLATLAELEEEGLGRKTVLETIRARLEAVA